MDLSISDEKQFRNKITMFSFWLSVGVIGIHTYNIESYALNMNTDNLSQMIIYIENWFREIQNICVPFFFIISGYLFFRTFEWSKLFDKYKSRLRTIFVPYIIWCSLYYIYFCLLSHISITRGYINNGLPIPVNLVTWLDWLWVDSYYTMWFLKDLILLIICTPIIYLFLKNRKNIPTGAGVLIILWFVNMAVSRITDVNLNSLILYSVGAYVGINHKAVPLIERTLVVYLSRICIIIILLINTFFIEQKILSNLLLQILMCISLWYAISGSYFTKQLPWWCKISFYIYCIHDFFLEAIEKLFLIVCGKASVFALLDYILAPIIVVILCILSATFLKKYCKHMWYVLVGGR